MPTPQAYFPEIMPDELLYSAIARFAFTAQLKSDVASEQLFGKRFIRFSYDLPSYVRDLATSIPGSNARDLLIQHTLLPFYTALMSAAQRDQIIERTLGNEQMIRNIVGAHSLVPRPSHLRFCPECETEQVRSYGFAYWKRMHQLPTSVVCVEHRRPLLASGASVKGYRVPRYEIAGSAKDHRPALLPSLPEVRFERFVMLAREGYRFLQWSGDMPPVTELSLRQTALDAGFERAESRGKKIDQQSLTAALESRDAEVAQLWPWLFERRRGVLVWIKLHTAKSAKNRNTFTHAVLSTFLRSYSKWAALPPTTSASDWDAVHLDPRLIAFGRAARAMSLQELVAEAEGTAAAIKNERPVVRAVLSEILRRSNVLRRALRIGQHEGLRLAIKAVCEDVLSFQQRRVADIIRSASEVDEELTITEVRIRSGIPDFDLIHKLLRACADSPYAGALDERAWQQMARLAKRT